VIVDLPFDNVNTAVNFMNLIETHKDKVYQLETAEGNEPQAKMVGSYDTEFANYPEHTILTVDWNAESQTYDAADYATISQTDIDRKQAYVDAKKAKLDAIQEAIDQAQAELDAQ
jgi:hypothetical protein